LFNKNHTCKISAALTVTVHGLVILLIIA
jgi:hypothetical protein